MALVIVVADGFEFLSMHDEDGAAITEFVEYMRCDGFHIAVRLDWENFKHLAWINHERIVLQTLYIDESYMINRPGDRK